MPTPRGSTPYDLARLRPGLRPFHLHFQLKVKSTNDFALVLRKRGKLFAPAVVVAGRQTAGRGRGKNFWWSDATAITATFVVPIEEALPPGELPLIAGLALRGAAAELTGRPSVKLKWPNDVLHDGRKLAGILCERADGVDLIGIGLNVNLDPDKAPPILRPAITSLRLIAGKTIDRGDALILLASHLHHAILARRKQPFSHFLLEYEKHHALLGRKVAITNDNSPRITGRVEGIDSQARLLVRDKSQLHRILAGHVTML